MNQEIRIQRQRQRRAWRVRKRMRGDASRPRLTVFRSHKHIYAQAVDDEQGTTLCSASSRTLCGAYGGTVEDARKVGTDLAEKLLALEIRRVRFDRGAFRYHGRVRALAEAARKKGLEF